jgi:hypothetical protein
MDDKWNAMFRQYGADIRPFVEVSSYIQSPDAAAIFIYKRECILSVRKEHRMNGLWDITVQNILSKHERKGSATRAILKLTLIASRLHVGVCISHAYSLGGQALCKRLIRNYGFSNTKDNTDEISLLFGEYLDPYTVYSPRNVKDYETRYYDTLGVSTKSPRRKRRKISYTI